MPTLLTPASTTNVFVSTRRSLPAVNVPLTVAEPVLVNVDTVVEPAFIVPVVFTLIVPDKSAVLIEPSNISTLLTVSAPTDAEIPVNCEPSPINPAAVTVPITYSVVAGVVVPMPTLLLAASTTNVLVSTRRSLPAVNVPLTVAEPVLVNVVTVVEPAFIVPVVFTLIVPDKSAVLIEPSIICALLTVSAPTLHGTFVNFEPSPINPAAVTVPITYSLVAGVVVPMPTFPSPRNRAVIVPLAFTIEKPLFGVLSFNVAVMSAALT